ncbi:hypothetical protein CEXT_160011, partial [Caerostris extrusa]
KGRRKKLEYLKFSKVCVFPSTVKRQIGDVPINDSPCTYSFEISTTFEFINMYAALTAMVVLGKPLEILTS